MNKILNWLAWGIVAIFYGGFVIGMLYMMITQIGWPVVLIILALVAVFWASNRIMTRVIR